MSDITKFEFALQEPALSIAPVFLTLSKKKDRRNFIVSREFNGAEITWHGPASLGVAEQSLFLTLLSIANQQNFWLSGNPEPKSIGEKLLPKMAIKTEAEGINLRVLKISKRRLVSALGYTSMGGNNPALVEASFQRLELTTIVDKRDGETTETHLLARVVGADDEVTVALNHRATNALNGGQFVKISLSERRILRDDRSKCLHAWLSGSLRLGTSRIYKIDSLQRPIWGNEEDGSALRQRRSRLRNALENIDALKTWQCNFIAPSRVEICRPPSRLARPICGLSVTNCGIISND